MVRKYKCRNCGKEIDSEENLWLEECPECGCDMDYAFKCDLCGEYHFECEEYEGDHVCEECIDKNCTLQNALNYGEENKESVSINGFLSYFFNEDEIHDILMQVLMECYSKDSEATNYLKQTTDFANFLKEQNRR